MTRYLSLPYTIELTPDEDGYWFAQIPLLKGCMIPEPVGVMPS